MGGKKPIGEHPSRGHLQRRFTGVTRRGGHTHRGNYWDPKSPFDDDNPNIVPVIQQEFSLFSEFDLSPDRFGILSKQTMDHKVSDLKDEIKIENVTTFCLENNMLPSQTTQGEPLTSTTQPQVHQQPVGEYESQSHVEMLQMTVFHLTSALERLEFQFYAAMNNLYCYGLPTHHQPQQQFPQQQLHQQAPRASSSPTTATASGEESSSNMIKRINERLSTLEGRQKIIQSKVSQLDNLYGQTTQAWGRSIKEIMRAGGGARPINNQSESHGNGDSHDDTELPEAVKSPKTDSNHSAMAISATGNPPQVHAPSASIEADHPDPQPSQDDRKDEHSQSTPPLPSSLAPPLIQRGIPATLLPLSETT
jgi:hypothetical protein